MKKTWNMIPKIMTGEKTIESRWYQTKRAPWDKIKKGDTVYFKNAGAPVVASAAVSKVMQYSLCDIQGIEEILKKYRKRICLPEDTIWNPLPKYCILIFLENPQPVKKPFSINKKGFGGPAAWLCVEDVRQLKIK